MPEQKITEDIGERILAAIGYIGILFLVPLLLGRDSEFAQFHARQGMVLFLCEVILSFVGIVPILGWLAAFIGGIISLILMIIGVLMALQGQRWKMPFLGQYAEKINL